MTDAQTNKPIHVSIHGSARPYIMVPVALLGRVRALLDQQAIPYWVESNAYSLDGKPPIAFLNLGRADDAGRVQALLDEEGS